MADKLGASCVEFNIQLTKDRTAVIFHDFRGNGNPGEGAFVYADIQSTQALQLFKVPKSGPN